MQSKNTLLNAEEAQRVEWGEKLDKDYFYLPVIYYSEGSPNDEELWYSLRFLDVEPPDSLIAYASKVPVGLTLWEAVRRDLRTDFNYSHDQSFMIEAAKPYDTAKTKDDRTLTRLLVWVSVNAKFNVDELEVVGMRPKWHEEGEHLFNPIYGYFR